MHVLTTLEKYHGMLIEHTTLQTLMEIILKIRNYTNNYNTYALLTLIIINSSKICSSFPPQPVPCTLNTKQRLSLQNKGKHREVTCISHIKLAQTWMTEVVKVLLAGLAIWILILTSQTSQAFTVRTRYQLLFTSGAREKCCLLCSYFYIFFLFHTWRRNEKSNISTHS